MSTQAIGYISGGAHFIISLLLALLATYGSFRIFDSLTRNLDETRELKQNNVAVGILIASMMISTAIILRQVTFPAVSTLQASLFQDVRWVELLRSVGLILAYIVLTMALAVASVWIALRVFVRMTRRLDEMAEIRKNNIAVAVMLGAAIVVMGIFLADGIGSMLNALVPFPTMAPVEVLGL